MVKIGLIGAGFMGKTYAQACSKIKGVEIAGIADPDMEKCSKIGKAYGAKTFADMDGLLGGAEADIIGICVPPYLHETLILKAAMAGKDVICEKPIALSLEAADNIIRTVKKTGIRLMIAHILHFIPEYAAIKKIVSGGHLGRPLMAMASRIDQLPKWGGWFGDPDKSGGAIVNIHIHDIDFLNVLFGSPVSVYSVGKRSSNNSWDHVVSTVHYQEGIKAVVEASFLMPDGYPFTQSLRILCEGGSAQLYIREETTTHVGNLDRKEVVVFHEGKPPQFINVSGDAFTDEIGYFVRCIRGNKHPQLGTPAQARLALVSVLAARESAETGKIVSLTDN